MAITTLEERWAGIAVGFSFSPSKSNQTATFIEPWFEVKQSYVALAEDAAIFSIFLRVGIPVPLFPQKCEHDSNFLNRKENENART